MFTLIVSAIVGFVCLVGGGYLGYRWGSSVASDIDALIGEIKKLDGGKE
jgi:hypothetical protein